MEYIQWNLSKKTISQSGPKYEVIFHNDTLKSMIRQDFSNRMRQLDVLVRLSCLICINSFGPSDVA